MGIAIRIFVLGVCVGCMLRGPSDTPTNRLAWRRRR